VSSFLNLVFFSEFIFDIFCFFLDFLVFFEFLLTLGEFIADFVEKGVVKHFSEALDSTSDVEIQCLVVSGMINFEDTQGRNVVETFGRTERQKVREGEGEGERGRGREERKGRREGEREERGQDIFLMTQKP
jgi:hypothetical protein